MNEQEKCPACRDGSRDALVSWGDDSHVYAARIAEHYWNGFATPAFTIEVVREIAADSRGVQGLCQVYEKRGSFTVHPCDVVDNNDHTTCDRSDDQVVESEECCGRYFVGDWWTWGEVEFGDLPQFTRAHLTGL
jgi:hypothetical protein